MGRTRLDLQNLLEEILSSKNVYYQSPGNLQMSYPAIIYSINKRSKTPADDIAYHNLTQYQIIIIDKRPDNVAISKLLEYEYTFWDRHYISDNLHHDVITIYY